LKTKNLAPRVTLSDVARRVGVAPSTVSYILRRVEPHFSRYAKDTIARVQQVAAEIGYAPSLLATSLRRRQVPFFGVFFEFVRRGDAAPDGGQSIMMWQVCEGIANAARQDHRYPVVLTSPNPASGLPASAHELDLIVRSGLSGVIAAVHPETWVNHVARWEEAGVPCISLFDAGSQDRPRWYVDLDNCAVGRSAWEYLYRHGHRRAICLHQSESSQAISDRMVAFSQAAGSACEQTRVEELILTPEQVRQADAGQFQSCRLLIDALERGGATAIFAADGGASLIAYQVLNAHGRRVPGECSIIGIDLPLWCSASGFVTQVTCSGTLIGQAAAKLLVERVNGESGEPRHTLVPPVLLERSSVGSV